MDLLTLRSDLKTLLSDYLGTYSWGDLTTPAIAVRSGNETLPAGTTVTGLEVVIDRTPQLDPQPAYSNAPVIQFWRVDLVQWSGDKLQTAQTKIAETYPNAEFRVLPASQLLGTLAQVEARLRLP
jgi:hypothetical protein